MKRFGKALLNPHHIRAVAPCFLVARTVTGESRTTVPHHYEVLFLDGNRIDLDTASALALIEHLAPSDTPQNADQPTLRPDAP